MKSENYAICSEALAILYNIAARETGHNEAFAQSLTAKLDEVQDLLYTAHRDAPGKAHGGGSNV